MLWGGSQRKNKKVLTQEVRTASQHSLPLALVPVASQRLLVDVKLPEVLMDGGEAKGRRLRGVSFEQSVQLCLSQFEGDFGICCTHMPLRRLFSSLILPLLLAKSNREFLSCQVKVTDTSWGESSVRAVPDGSVIPVNITSVLARPPCRYTEGLLGGCYLLL